MYMDFTQEQSDFAKSVASFCKKESGTREQRDLLTDHGAHNHNQAFYEKMAELGWLGLTVPEEYGGSAGSTVDLCIFLGGSRQGHGADRWTRPDRHHRGCIREVRQSGPEGGSARRDRPWRVSVDLDVRTRSGLRRGKSELPPPRRSTVGG